MAKFITENLHKTQINIATRNRDRYDLSFIKTCVENGPNFYEENLVLEFRNIYLKLHFIYTKNLIH